MGFAIIKKIELSLAHSLTRVHIAIRISSILTLATHQFLPFGHCHLIFTSTLIKNQNVNNNRTT